MLSFLFPRWCKPGLGPVGQMKLLEVLPAADFASLGMGEVSQFVKQLAHLGLPGKLSRRYGQLFFRFLVQCQGPTRKIRLFFAVPDIRLMGFQAAFQTLNSGIYLLPASESANPFSKIHEHTITAEGRSTNRGLFSAAPFHFTDQTPLSAQMMAMGAGELKSGEEVWLDIAFAPVSRREVQKRIQKAERQSNLFRSLKGKRSGEDLRFWTSIRVVIHSFSSKARLQTMNAALQSMKDLNGILLRPVRPEKMKARYERGAPTQGFLFTSEELAPWLRLPDTGSAVAPFVKTMAAKCNDRGEGYLWTIN